LARWSQGQHWFEGAGAGAHPEPSPIGSAVAAVWREVSGDPHTRLRHMIKLWNDFYDPRLSKTKIINNALEDIAPDQWALFVEYRLKPETQVSTYSPS